MEINFSQGLLTLSNRVVKSESEFPIKFGAFILQGKQCEQEMGTKCLSPACRNKKYEIAMIWQM